MLIKLSKTNLVDVKLNSKNILFYNIFKIGLHFRVIVDFVSVGLGIVL